VAAAAREISADVPLFYQLYVPKQTEGQQMDRALTARLLRYAEEAGYAAVFITTDQQVPGNRWRTTRDREWVPSPEHKYVDQNSGLAEIYLPFVRPILILM
jgi:predicted GNAT family acetyltransferase